MSSAAPGVLHGLDVLLVEDESLVALMMEDMLLELGAASIRHAARVEIALELISQKRPAVAVVDVNLAGALAYPVAERLAECKVPFIFVTGYDIRAVDPRFTSREALQKPVTLGRLEQTLQTLLMPSRREMAID